MRRLFKKIRYSLHLSLALLKKHQKLIAIGFLIGIATFVFFSKWGRNFWQKKTTRIALVGRYSLEELPLSIQKKVSQGLTTMATDYRAVPELAKKWEINQGGKEYIFTLKDKLTWQDGKPLAASEIDYHFSDVKTSALNEKQIKFELKEAFSPFLSVVSRPVFKKPLVGTGEYRIKSIKSEGGIINQLTLVSLKDKDRLVYRFYPSEETARTAFKLGEVDRLEKISSLGDLENWPRSKVEPQIEYQRFVAIFFNTQAPFLEDKSVRQALAYTIDKRWQPRAFNSYDPRSWVYNNQVKPYSFDLANARKLLESTLPEGSSGLTEIELQTIPSLLPTAEQIAKDWQQIGLTTQIRVISTLEPDFQALLISQEIPLDPDQYIFWHSTQKLNLSRFKSPRIDKLLEDGRKTFDAEERKQIYQDFQRFIVEETPAVFLYYPTLYTVSRI